MELAYKHNWPEARERLEAFWHMDIIDRPCIAVSAPQQPRRPVPAPTDYRTKWTDPDYVVQNLDAGHEATYFGGEAMPGGSLLVGYCFAYGAALHFSEQTVWHDPIIESWTDAPDLVVDEDDWGWRQIQAVIARCAELADGKWVVPNPALMQPNDLIAVLRGGEPFYLDMIDHPGELARALRQALDNYFLMYERLRGLMPETQQGSISWLPVWCPWARTNTIQSDISCAISSEMFERFIAPELEAQCDWHDATLYHLDGPGALHHVDRLLAIEALHGIQWTAGTGHPTGLAWLDLYKRIQAGGKGVIVSLAYDEVETAVRELRPEGLFILTGAASPDAADALLERAAAITAQKRTGPARQA